MSNIIDVTINNFDELMANKTLVLDFYGETCRPCEIFLPIIEDFASRKFAEATYGKINAAENSELSAMFGVRAVPTVVVIRDGIEVNRKTGTISKSDLETLINN